MMEKRSASKSGIGLPSGSGSHAVGGLRLSLPSESNAGKAAATEARLRSSLPSGSNAGKAAASEAALHLSPPSGSNASKAAASEGTAGSVNPAIFGRVRIPLDIASSKSSSENDEGEAPSKRVRKDRGPNWSAQEVNALIEAKRTHHRQEQKAADARELMMPDAGKWQRVSALVMAAGVSPCKRDGIACKSKWNQIIPEYKKIADYVKRSGSDDASYWHLSFAKRREERLPKQFPHNVFWSIHDWYGLSPAMLPTHDRDLLQPEDTSYKNPSTGSDEVEELDGSHEDNQDVLFDVQGDGTSDSFTASRRLPSSSGGHAIASDRPRQMQSSPCPTQLPTAKSYLPPGVTPQLLSSSDTTPATILERPSNTGVRRKAISGHTLIAETTKATGKALTTQMQAAANISRDIENAKLDMQLRQFNEQMQYQKDRDKRLRQNARITQENARLSIEKQGEVVQSLNTLASVLSVAFLQRPLQRPTPSNEVVATTKQGLPTEASPPRIGKASAADLEASTDDWSLPRCPL